MTDLLTVRHRGKDRKKEHEEEEDSTSVVHARCNGDISLSHSASDNVRRQTMKLRAEFLEQVDGHLDKLLEKVALVHKTPDECVSSDNDNGSNDRKRKTHKVFVERESLLTTLFLSEEIKTIYNIFVAILIVMSLNTLVYDLMAQGRLVLDFSHIGWAFGQFPLVITLWMVMQAQALLAFPAFQMWTLTRSESRLRIAVIDMLWLLAYILFQVTFIIYPIIAVYSWELPLASTIVVTCEQVRFLMKVHAFVRENAVKVVCPASQDLPKGNTLELPGFSKYLYFLFVPTLIYRDTYPRTNVIRWKYVVTNFAQVVACLFYTYYIFARFLVPVFHNVGREPLSLRNLTLLTFSSMVPGMMILILGFFCILHSWMNAFAEMMRFADREFYQDWWNSRQFARFYRTWNIIVHEWLYYYVFRDTMRLCQNSHRKEAIARVTVFVLSAVVHEYVIAAMLRFFYPIMLIMFGGVGFSFIWLTKNREYRVWNVFMWVMLFMGCGMLMTLYTHEWYVRRNCPLYDDFWANYFVPRTWTCNYASPM